MDGKTEDYKKKIIEMVNSIDNKDYLIRIYSFVKFKYDNTKNKK